MTAILVAGGAGYIGSHICKALAASGHLPVTLDDLSAGHSDAVKWGPLVVAGVDQHNAVAAAIADHRIVAAIDLSGCIEVGESVRDPLKFYENNVGAKVGFLRTLLEGGINRIVLSSTAAVYGEPDAVPIPEAHPKRPKNPYGWTKLIYEQMLADLERSAGLNWMALRYFNAAGASPDGDIGERHDPETHLIPRACLAALGRIPPLEIFGDDYPTPDGTAIRDYVHVSDLANAHVKAVEALMAGKSSAAYNLGTGNGTSVKEILAVFAAMGHEVPHRFCARRAGDPARLVADPGAAERDLGWSAKHSDTQTVIGSAWGWQCRLKFAT